MKRVNRISFFSLLSRLSNSPLFYMDTRDHNVVARSPYYEQTEHMQSQPRQKSITLDPKMWLCKMLTANLEDMMRVLLAASELRDFFHNARLCDQGVTCVMVSVNIAATIMMAGDIL